MRLVYSPKLGIFFCLILFCLHNPNRAGGQSTPDPGLPGPYTVSKETYKLSDVFIPSLTVVPYYSEMVGTVHYPSSLSSPTYPIIILLHGNHSICYRDTDSSCCYSWPLSPGYTMIPNYDGYDYFARHLASHGFIVVSISANAVNFRAHDMMDRAFLIQKHLEIWDQFNSVGGAPFGLKFIGKVDLTNIGLMGHSRGGEGVIAYGIYNRSISSPYKVKAILSIGPTRFFSYTLNRIPFMNIAPYCDGDVGVGTGLQSYDDVRYNDDWDDAPKYGVLMMGANHNYFNTVWTPGSFFACASDDWSEDIYPFCSPSSGSSGRYDSLQQRKALTAYGSAFFRTHMLGDASFKPILEVNDIIPPRTTTLDSSRIFVSFHPAKNRRLDFNTMTDRAHLDSNNLGGAVVANNLTSFDILSCRYAHWNAIESTCLSWADTSAYYENQLPPAYRDLSTYSNLIFRTSFLYPLVNKSSGKIDFSIQLTDADGNTGTQIYSARSNAIFNYADDLYSISNTVKFPLDSFSSVNLTKVEKIRFLFDKTKTGALFFSDIAFERKGRLCLLYSDFVSFFAGGQKVFFSDSSQVSAEDSVGWLWNFGDPLSASDNNSSLKNPNHIFSDSGYFNVCLYISSYGKDGLICHDTVCRRIYVEYDPMLDAATYSMNNILAIYPNPAKDFFKIEVTEPGSELYVFNSLGQCVCHSTLHSDKLFRFHLKDGIYTVVIKQGDRRSVKRLCVINDQ